MLEIAVVLYFSFIYSNVNVSNDQYSLNSDRDGNN